MLECLMDFFNNHLWLVPIVIAAIFVTRILFSNDMMLTYLDWILVPPFVSIGGVVCDRCYSKLRRVLLLFGKYSLYIWLTHTFFFYYYWQKEVFALKLIPIIYVVTLVICLLIGILLNKILENIYFLIKSANSKGSY